MSDAAGYLMYKGKPVVRSGNIIYYGYPYESHVAMLQIIKSEKEDDIAISSKIVVQLLSTDETKNPAERIIKKSEKKGLYDALNIASIWLDRLLTQTSK